VPSSAHRQNPRDQRPFNLMATHSGPARADDAIQGGARPMRIPRLATILALFPLLLGGLAVMPPRPAAAQGEACFQETGFCVQGRFLDYWQQHGGLATNGFPLGEERREVLEDGQVYVVQYFERARFELHPENPAPFDVLLGQFGRRWLRTAPLPNAADTAPATARPGMAYFPETGHNLGGRFLDYWQANGGLAQFGYPLTEEFTEQLEDGNTYQVQYFERARFELHPENPAPFDVLLGQFGRRIQAENGWLDGEPDFKYYFVTSEQVQAALGRPGGPVVGEPAAYQGFERGAMIWQGDLRLIYVLCGGTSGAGTSVLTFEDTWAEGQPSGGGAGPGPGLYEPGRGFGKVWREQAAARDCLGYATSAGETAYTGARLGFLRGTLLTAATPEGRFIYAAYRLQNPTPCGDRAQPPCRTAYERFPSLSRR